MPYLINSKTKFDLLKFKGKIKNKLKLQGNNILCVKMLDKSERYFATGGSDSLIIIWKLN